MKGRVVHKKTAERMPPWYRPEWNGQLSNRSIVAGPEAMYSFSAPGGILEQTVNPADVTEQSIRSSIPERRPTTQAFDPSVEANRTETMTV